MGREIRRVPSDWEHPVDERGRLIPLHDEEFDTAEREWVEGWHLWQEGKHPDQDPELKYADWFGTSPDPESYRNRSWTPEEATCYQVYETVSEGTPVSPVFDSLDEMVAWLIEEGYSPGAAKQFAKDGWVPSMIMTGGTLFSDIESADKLPKRED